MKLPAWIDHAALKGRLVMLAMLAACTLALTSLSGCALFGDQIAESAEAAGKAVTFYCENVTVPEIRDQFRAAVNAEAAPHSIAVTCASPTPTASPPPGANNLDIREKADMPKFTVTADDTTDAAIYLQSTRRGTVGLEAGKHAVFQMLPGEILVIRAADARDPDGVELAQPPFVHETGEETPKPAGAGIADDV